MVVNGWVAALAVIATGLDAIGSRHNNISSMALMDEHVIELGFELFMPNCRRYASTGGAAGSVSSETREAVIPSMGSIHDSEGPWSFGFSALGFGLSTLVIVVLAMIAGFMAHKFIFEKTA